MNTDRLVEVGVQAEVAHPTHPGTYAVDSYGRPIILPGMAGVVANARVGDPVFPWAADHLEPGVSAGNPQRDRYQALQFLSCIGNVVRVLTGPAAGAKGRVTGKHAFVLIDFPQDALDVLAPGDGLLVRAVGQGLRFLDFDVTPGQEYAYRVRLKFTPTGVHPSIGHRDKGVGAPPVPTLWMIIFGSLICA